MGNTLAWLLWTLGAALPALLLVYAWTAFSRIGAPGEKLQPRAAVELPDTSGVREKYVGAQLPLWAADETEPWVVAKPVQELPPVDLPPPVPSVPLPPTPLPTPGPRLEHAGQLPRWGSFPAPTMQKAP